MCISFRCFVSKLYSNFREDKVREKVERHRTRGSNFCDIANFKSESVRSARENSYLYITQHPLVFCTELDSLSRNHIVNHRHSKISLAIFVCRKCKGDVRSPTLFLKLFQNDSFFMPNLSTDFSINPSAVDGRR